MCPIMKYNITIEFSDVIAGGVPLSILSILSLSFFSFFWTGQCFGDKMDNTGDKRDKNFGQMRQKIRQAQM